MTSTVIRKDGTKQPFDSEKIKKSISNAAREANLSEERQNEVVEEVTNKVIQSIQEKDEVATSEIREKILAELDSVEPSVSAAWRKYEEEKSNKEVV